MTKVELTEEQRQLLFEVAFGRYEQFFIKDLLVGEAGNLMYLRKYDLISWGTQYRHSSSLHITDLGRKYL